MGVVEDLLKDTPLPLMAKIRQVVPCPVLEDLPVAELEQLNRANISTTVKPGMKIAVGVGSRGVSNLQKIVKVLIQWLKDNGAEPFIIPTMGSHGGATAEGQLEILSGYGITEKECRCPVRASMETVEIGQTEEGHHVFIDKMAAQADGIVIVGRVKPHPCFTGPYESGLMKMLAIGLGKQKGAENCHRAGFKHMAHMVPLFGKVILRKSNVLFGIALVENAHEETCAIRTMTPEEIIKDEPDILLYSKSMMPKIPFAETDVLIVGKIGKNYSGDGMDPHVTGTFVTPYASGGINAQKVVVLDLAEESHGNGVGMGNADVINRRVFEKTDLEKTYPNVITSKVVCCVAVPIMLDNDRLAIQCAAKICTNVDYDRLRIVRIHNSLHIDEMWISEALYNETKSMDGIEVLEAPKPFEFDKQGNLFCCRYHNPF